MFDRSRAHGRSTGHLTPAPLDASARHYWLMRRELRLAPVPDEWPSPLRVAAFTADNARQTHQLLMLGRQHGGGRVADFNTWLNAFDTDPECDPRLIFVAEDANGVVGVAQCWTSAFIRNLAVHPGAQGQGIGRRLLEHAFSAFYQRREHHVDLKVMENNLTARRLYERAGMQYVRRVELDSD
jgi:ribosomal protein S18 acetylase RimI-like enzyme